MSRRRGRRWFVVPLGVYVIRIDSGLGAEVLAVAVRVVDPIVTGVGVTIGDQRRGLRLPIARLRVAGERGNVRQRVVQPDVMTQDNKFTISCSL